LFGDYPFEMEDDEWLFLFQVYTALFQVSSFRFQVVRIILRGLI
jgi:hypothetical protein